MHKRLLALALGAALAAPTLWAFDFNFRTSDAEPGSWGSEKRDTYDVAVRLGAPVLRGMKITEISVPLSAPSAEKTTIWLSSELKLKKVSGVKSNDPDLLTVEATVGADGVLRAVLPEPYTIPEGGLYAGYSFSLSAADQDADKMPVAVYPGENADGLWVHSSRAYVNWEDLSAKTGYVSAINVKLDGELPAYAAGIVGVADAYAKAGEPLTLTVQVANHGTEPLSSFTYHYSLPAGEGDGTYAFPEPIKPYFNAVHPVELTLPATSERGHYDASLSVTRAADAANAENGAVAFPLRVLQFVPKKVVVMEEYTSTSCGWCPRGTACIEHLTHDYPDRFIGVAWHRSDEMEMASLPASPDGLPAAYLDRGSDIGAGYWEVFPSFQQMTGKLPQANIEVSARLDGDEIVADSRTIFLADKTGAGCRVAYLLIGDGISSKKWIQSNYYADCTDEQKQNYKDLDPYLAEYCDELPAKLKDYKFPAVVVYCKDPNGIGSSLPENIEADTWMEHSTVIPVADVVGRGGDNLIQEDASYRLVAMVIDGNTRRILNAAVCPVEGLAAGLHSLPTDNADTPAVYYNLQGQRVDAPSHGIYIKVQGARATKVAK